MPDDLKRLIISYSSDVFSGGSESKIPSELLRAIRGVHSSFSPKDHDSNDHYVVGEIPESKVGKLLGLEGITTVEEDAQLDMLVKSRYQRPTVSGAAPEGGPAWYSLIIDENPTLEAECIGKSIWIDPVTGDFEIGHGIEPIDNLTDRIGQVAERFYYRQVGQLERL